VADLVELGDCPCELSRGELVVMGPPAPVHARCVARLAAALLAFVEEHELGEVYAGDTGFRLPPDPGATVRAPDIAFVRRERIPPPDEQEGYWPLAPDLAVEVVSPSDRPPDLEEKVADFLAAGSELVWLLYPRSKTARVHRAGGEVQELGLADSLDGGALLPGFGCSLARLFR
jgi:Uma2 family endonuclease